MPGRREDMKEASQGTRPMPRRQVPLLKGRRRFILGPRLRTVHGQNRYSGSAPASQRLLVHNAFHVVTVFACFCVRFGVYFLRLLLLACKLSLLTNITNKGGDSSSTIHLFGSPWLARTAAPEVSRPPSPCRTARTSRSTGGT